MCRHGTAKVEKGTPFMAEAEQIIGIDFGTTNSVVAVYMNGDVQVIPNLQGHILTPSVVAFTENETLVVSGR